MNYENSWISLQEKLSAKEEENIAIVTELNLCKTRIQEETATKFSLQNEVKELISKKSLLEEEHRNRLVIVNQQYENEIKFIKQTQEQVKFQSFVAVYPLLNCYCDYDRR